MAVVLVPLPDEQIECHQSILYLNRELFLVLEKLLFPVTKRVFLNTDIVRPSSIVKVWFVGKIFYPRN